MVDDWNGFGQTLTASGTAHFDNVRVEPEDIEFEGKFLYATGFFQLVHFATLAGIGGAMGALYAGYSWNTLGPTITFSMASVAALAAAVIIATRLQEDRP